MKSSEGEARSDPSSSAQSSSPSTRKRNWTQTVVGCLGLSSLPQTRDEASLFTLQIMAGLTVSMKLSHAEIVLLLFIMPRSTFQFFVILISTLRMFMIL